MTTIGFDLVLRLSPRLLILITLMLAACNSATQNQGAQVERISEHDREGISVERPDAPPELNAEFRSDSVTQVGATGNPQLIKVFTYW